MDPSYPGAAGTAARASSRPSVSWQDAESDSREGMVPGACALREGRVEGRLRTRRSLDQQKQVSYRRGGAGTRSGRYPRIRGQNITIKTGARRPAGRKVARVTLR